MASNKKITELTELSEVNLAADDVLAIVDVSSGTTHKVRKDTLASALSGVSSIIATSPLAVDSSIGTVTVSTGTIPVSKGGTGATTLTDGGVLLGSGTGAVTALSVLSDGQMIVGDGTGDPVAESGATLRTSIGLGTLAVENVNAVPSLTMAGALHLTAGSLTGDAATIRQIQDGAMSYVASDTGSANAYAIALSPAVTSYVAGLVVHFIPANNSTGASTINVSALGTKAIQIQGEAVSGANITTTGICSLIYDGTQFQMFSLDKVNTAATIGLILALGG